MRSAELTSNLKPESAPAYPLEGRDQEVGDLCDLLTREQPAVNGHVGSCRPRLVTLSGCHGIGKSVIAHAVASQLTAPPVVNSNATMTSSASAVVGGVLKSADTSVVRDTTAEGGVNHANGSLYAVVVTVECRGCDGTRESLLARIYGTFGLPYRAPHDNGTLPIGFFLQPGNIALSCNDFCSAESSRETIDILFVT